MVFLFVLVGPAQCLVLQNTVTQLAKGFLLCLHEIIVLIGVPKFFFSACGRFGGFYIL